jgi:hypothetical protein
MSTRNSHITTLLGPNMDLAFALGEFELPHSTCTNLHGEIHIAAWFLWQIALQTRPLVREGAPRRSAKQFSGQKKGKSKIWSWAPKGCPTPRHTDWLTDWPSVVKNFRLRPHANGRTRVLANTHEGKRDAAHTASPVRLNSALICTSYKGQLLLVAILGFVRSYSWLQTRQVVLETLSFEGFPYGTLGPPTFIP